MIMPRVTACLLRHLPWLQVVDLSNLHTGIEHYYRGSTHRQSRVKSLNLVHYTGSDRLAEVMEICPKLRTFKLFVTAQLPQLGYTLQVRNKTLSFTNFHVNAEVDYRISHSPVPTIPAPLPFLTAI
ncbi:uncharacterized protein LOC111709993, partial [Eurytemora carolleeae]|uniref:uncharacterized protein LOC111709993 n=1 Tax=Eurytemora carolleeae TaxID=1294199 RepID=UPI000C77000E